MTQRGGSWTEGMLHLDQVSEQTQTHSISALWTLLSGSLFFLLLDCVMWTKMSLLYLTQINDTYKLCFIFAGHLSLNLLVSMRLKIYF